MPRQAAFAARAEARPQRQPRGEGSYVLVLNGVPALRQASVVEQAVLGADDVEAVAARELVRVFSHAQLNNEPDIIVVSSKFNI